MSETERAAPALLSMTPPPMEEAKYFRSFSEIRLREAFDPDCEITVENFVSLIGEYHFAEDEVPCQVRPIDQSRRCFEEHKNGWLGRRKDGKEALIGRVCGTKYFHASSAFIAQRRRLARELNINGYIERLQATRGASLYAEELERTIVRLRAVRTAAKDWEERLPTLIVSRLQRMVKSSNAAVGVEFRYEDEDDDGNPTVEWVSYQLGVVAGVAICDQARMGALFKVLHEIRDAHREARIDRSAGERDLRRWADKLDELPNCVGRVSELESALNSFREPSSLQLLCFTVANQDIAINMARVVIEEQHGGHAGAPVSPRTLYKELAADVRAHAGGRDFRVLG
jgi:hypothetical protein